MDIVYNGEIYLKKGPEVYDPAFDIKEIDSKIEALESLGKQDFITMITIKMGKELKSTLEKQKGKLDYSGTDLFWRIYTSDGENIIMKNDYSVREYNSTSEVKKLYIKLLEFLNTSQYIGKEFVRTKPISTNGMIDKSFTHSKDEENIVLYATKDLLLALKREIDKGKMMSEYILINDYYTKDRNYLFTGKTNTEYQDKTKVYRQIRKQLERKGI